MNIDVIQALEELEKEKGISKEVLLDALEAALISAFKRNYGSAQNVRIDLDGDSGIIKVLARKTVSEDPSDARLELSLDEARKIDPTYDIGDVVEIEVTPKEFGRIAAQTAKQVVVQRIREAERDIIYEEYMNRQGDIITGRIQRTEDRNVMVDLGKAEGILTPSEQMRGERYEHGQRLKMYIVDVRKTTKGPQVLVSRTHPGLLKRLFELEVPEVFDGTVEIKAIAREAGTRSKVAVVSYDENVDPVGACVGHRGVRIQSIVSELKGEKIDVIEWNDETAIFIANSLSPAKVLAVSTNDEYKMTRVIVPDNQLSLAIGKEGQNARLAARISGWKIDIKSESQYIEMIEEAERAAIEEESEELAGEGDGESAYDETDTGEDIGPEGGELQGEYENTETPEDPDAEEIKQI